MNSNTSVTIPDEELVMELRTGNRNAFGALYSKYFPLVYSQCYSFFNDRDTARDHTQDIMIRVIDKVNTFNHQARFSTWLFRLTVNHCIDSQRKARTQTKRIKSIQGEEVDSEYPMHYDSLLEKLRTALELPENQDNELLSQKYLQRKSIEELTEIYQISQSAVKMRLSRARDRMAHSLKAELNFINQ